MPRFLILFLISSIFIFGLQAQTAQLQLEHNHSELYEGIDNYILAENWKWTSGKSLKLSCHRKIKISRTGQRRWKVVPVNTDTLVFYLKDNNGLLLDSIACPSIRLRSHMVITHPRLGDLKSGEYDAALVREFRGILPRYNHPSRQPQAQSCTLTYHSIDAERPVQLKFNFKNSQFPKKVQALVQQVQRGDVLEFSDLKYRPLRDVPAIPKLSGIRIVVR